MRKGLNWKETAPMCNGELELAARRLAKANAESEETILRVYWFPNDKQIRLVEVDRDSIRTRDESIRPFYFDSVKDVPFPSAVALIHPDEEARKTLPKEWDADWSSAIVVFDRESEGA